MLFRRASTGPNAFYPAVIAGLWNTVRVCHPDIEHRDPDNIPTEVPNCGELSSHLRLQIARCWLARLRFNQTCEVPLHWQEVVRIGGIDSEVRLLLLLWGALCNQAVGPACCPHMSDNGDIIVPASMAHPLRYCALVSAHDDH